MIFCVTFGQVHPLRDNWIEIEAEDEATARKEIFAVLGNKWGFMYEQSQFDAEYFRAGKVGRTLIAPSY